MLRSFHSGHSATIVAEMVVRDLEARPDQIPGEETVGGAVGRHLLGVDVEADVGERRCEPSDVFSPNGCRRRRRPKCSRAWIVVPHLDVVSKPPPARSPPGHGQRRSKTIPGEN